MRHSGDGEVGNLHSERKERGGCSTAGLSPFAPTLPHAPPSLCSGAPGRRVGGSAPLGKPEAGCGQRLLQEGM